MFNCYDSVRINCPYFNNDVNGKIGKIVSDGKYDGIKFDKAIIKMPDDTVKEIDIESWTDYDDGEQLQIVATNGDVYLVSSINCILVKEKR